MSNSIHIQGLVKEYGKPRNSHYVRALDGVSVDIPQGNIVALMGENGSGKSTMLKILAGAISDYQGEVLLGGEKVGVTTKARTSYLPDVSALPLHLTGVEVVRMYSEFFADFDADKALNKLNYFLVPADRPGSTLSKGQREKMHIAMALSRHVDFYLLDEPIGGVDPAAREHIIHGILEDLPSNSTMIISTHIIQDVEPLASYGLFMRAGHVLLSGDADEIRRNSGGSLDSVFRQMYQWGVK